MSECKKCDDLRTETCDLEDRISDLSAELEDKCDGCGFNDNHYEHDLHAAQAVIYDLHNAHGICLCGHCTAHRTERNRL